MDRRQIIIVALAVVLLVLWQPIMFRVGSWLGYDMTARPAATQPATQPGPTEVVDTGLTPGGTTNPSTLTVEPTTRTAGGPSISPASNPAPAGGTDPNRLRALTPGVEPRVEVLGSDKPNDPTYAMQVTLSPRGAGIDRVVLNQFKRDVDKPDRYAFEFPYDAQPDASRPLATESVVIAGQTVDLSRVIWTLEPDENPDVATYRVDIGTDAGVFATVRKTFAISKRTDGGDAGPLGYELTVTQEVENKANGPFELGGQIAGPTVPPAEVVYGADRATLAGYFDGSVIEAHQVGVESFTKLGEPQDLLTYKERKAVWFGAGSTYFASILRAVDPATGRPTNAPFEKISAVLVAENVKPPVRPVAIDVTLARQTVAPGVKATLPLKLYVGPRDRGVLANAYYADPYLKLNSMLVIATGPCSFCVFSWLIDPLVWLLRLFHAVTFDWGLAIILLVCLVRVILHPITKKSQLSMLKFQKFAPELERIKKKHADNKDELSRAMMQFYKEKGVGAIPVMGCLPMFLQMPIWIALWNSLHTTFELRHAPFLYGLTWIDDLAKPDNLIRFAEPVEFLFLHISGLNVLPILLGVVFYLQMKFQPQPPSMSPEQEQQQKIMKVMMPLMMPLFLYSGPSGLTVYILTSTVIGIIESKVVRDHAKKLDALEASGAVVVDAEPDTRRGPGGKGAKAAKKQGGIAGWLANLQEKAEQMRREADRKGKR